MKIIISAVVTLILLFFFIRFIEKKSLYYPLKKIEATPRDIGLDYEEIFITTKDKVLISGWYIPSGSPRATFIFSHGNGGNISHRLEKIKMFNDLRVNVLIFDYRGYGMSEGSLSEEASISMQKLSMITLLMKSRSLRKRSSVMANPWEARSWSTWQSGVKWEG